MRSAGRTPWTRPTSGPSRSPRTGAARATALIVHWPKGIQAKGEVRTQFHHVIDVAPTVLEAAGLPEPVMVHGVQQKPLEGVSMALLLRRSPGAAERHETQYFEMFVNRGIYHKGWTAVTQHSIPWPHRAAEICRLSTTTMWELYDTNTDWTQAHDLAKEMPEKLHELQRLFLIEAAKYNVLPLDDRRVERFNTELAGRPHPDQGQITASFQRHGPPG